MPKKGKGQGFHLFLPDGAILLAFYAFLYCLPDDFVRNEKGLSTRKNCTQTLIVSDYQSALFFRLTLEKADS
jgi:hypothetical protein